MYHTEATSVVTKKGITVQQQISNCLQAVVELSFIFLQTLMLGFLSGIKNLLVVLQPVAENHNRYFSGNMFSEHSFRPFLGKCTFIATFKKIRQLFFNKRYPGHMSVECSWSHRFTHPHQNLLNQNVIPEKSILPVYF